MCGRFALYATPEDLAEHFGLAEPPAQLAPRYNIAPTQPVGIIRFDPQRQRREWALVLWGLIPSWSKEPAMAARMINARAETVAEKPSFRTAFRRRRCIIPASGFYEWMKRNGGKQPYYITSHDGTPLGFAGLWERWIGPEGEEIESCTILTTDANEEVARLHTRMPVILAPEDYATWLGDGQEAAPAYLTQLKHLFRPFPVGRLKLYPVSPYVNNPRNEGVACIEERNA